MLDHPMGCGCSPECAGKQRIAKIMSAPRESWKQPRGRQRTTLHREHDVQRELVKWLRARGHHVMAIPNAGRTTARGNSYLRAEGFTSGAPDLVVSAKDGRTVFVETKSEVGKVSPKQLEVHAELRARGRQVLVVYGLQDAVRKCQEAGL